MSSRIFTDSSLLSEYRKTTRTDLLDELLAHSIFVLCINQTVLSEYLFHHLAVFGGKAPLTIKSNRGIANVFHQKPPHPFLHLFEWLSDDDKMPHEAVHLMENYNLLPNDALILSSCKQHNIKALASYDPDFVTICQAEGIALLQTVADFEQFKKQV